MALTVTLMKTAKKRNSTSAGFDRTNVRIERPVLKGACSITNPVLEFNFWASVNFTDAKFEQALKSNYLFIKEFDRYYFIDEWVVEGKIAVAKCSCDVLATYRDAINNSTQYVLRSSQKCDGSILDTAYPTKTEPVIEESRGLLDRPFLNSFATGLFVVGIINNDIASASPTSFYAFTNSQMRDLSHYLMDNPSWLGIDITEISQELSKALINPLQYIVSCVYIPKSFSSIVPNLELISSIPYGWYNIPLPCYRIKSASVCYSFSDVVIVGNHPQFDADKRYLNSNTYTKRRIEIPGFGCFQIDSDALDIGDNRICCDFTIELSSGKCLCEVSIEDREPLFVTAAQIGVPVQMAQMSRDLLGAASAFTSAISGVGLSAALGIGGNLISTATTAIESAVKASMPTLTRTENTGSLSAYTRPIKVVSTFYKIVDQCPRLLGNPLCQNYKIGDLTGYILCGNASLDVDCTADEYTQIVGYLNSGFYNEVATGIM